MVISIDKYLELPSGKQRPSFFPTGTIFSNINNSYSYSELTMNAFKLKWITMPLKKEEYDNIIRIIKKNNIPFKEI